MQRKRTPLIDRIMRLTVEVGDCLEWTGATNGGVPIASVGGRNGGKINVRKALYDATHLKRQPKGTCYSSTCRNRLCVRVSHIDPRPRDVHQQIASEERLPSMARNRKISASRRTIPDDVYRTILIDSRPYKQIADEYRVSPYTVGRYKRGELRRASNVFAGLM